MIQPRCIRKMRRVICRCIRHCYGYATHATAAYMMLPRAITRRRFLRCRGAAAYGAAARHAIRPGRHDSLSLSLSSSSSSALIRHDIAYDIVSIILPEDYTRALLRGAAASAAATIIVRDSVVVSDMRKRRAFLLSLFFDSGMLQIAICLRAMMLKMPLRR